MTTEVIVRQTKPATSILGMMLSSSIWRSSSVVPICLETSVETTNVPGKPNRQEQAMPQAICQLNLKILPTTAAITNMLSRPMTNAPRTTGRRLRTSCGVTAVRNTRMETMQITRPMP